MKAKRLVALGALTALIILTVSLLRPAFNPTSTNIMNAGGITSVSDSKGLQLTLGLNPTTISPGEIVQLNLDEKNTLAKREVVQMGNTWPLQNLSVSPCGREYFPYGIAVYLGTYVKTNLTLGKQLDIFSSPAGTNSSGANCPSPFYTTPRLYDFKPNSDMVNVSYNQGPNVTLRLDDTISLSTYLAPGGQLKTFGQGNYTVVIGNCWGDELISYFKVKNT